MMNFAPAAGSVQRLGKVTVGTAQAAIAFVAIPQGYSALQVVITGRGTNASTSVNLLMRMAQTGTSYDTGANYDWVAMNGLGTSNANAEGIGATSAVVGALAAASAPAGAAGNADVLLPDYAGSTFHKTFVSRGGRKDAASSGNLRAVNIAGHWRNTAPIVAIELSLSAGNFDTGTVAALYGIR